MVAALLVGGPKSALCFASALVPFRMMEPRPTIDVVVRAHKQDVADLRFHRFSLSGGEIVVRDRLRVTSIERTLLDLASLGVDVDRLAHEAIAKRLTTQTKLRHTATEHRGRKGAPALLAAANAKHVRSKLERKFLTFLTDHGLPLPETNVKLGRHTVDGLYEDQKLVIELDEDGHRSAWAFEVDRERDRDHAATGHRTMRITEDALKDPLARVLRQALASRPR
jgi:very-short-patch-repair endonuclease